MISPDVPHAGSARANFADSHRRLTLFAQGLAGQYLHLKLFECPGGRARAGRIGKDGDSIFLPAAIGDFATIEHNMGAYRIAVLRQIGYRTEGTFDFDLQRFLASWPRPALLRHVFSRVEHIRIDATIRQRYPGARADLDRVRAHALARVPRGRAARPLTALLQALRRFSLGAARTALLVDDAGRFARRGAG